MIGVVDIVNLLQAAMHAGRVHSSRTARTSKSRRWDDRPKSTRRRIEVIFVLLLHSRIYRSEMAINRRVPLVTDYKSTMPSIAGPSTCHCSIAMRPSSGQGADSTRKKTAGVTLQAIGEGRLPCPSFPTPCSRPARRALSRFEKNRQR